MLLPIALTIPPKTGNNVLLQHEVKAGSGAASIVSSIFLHCFFMNIEEWEQQQPLQQMSNGCQNDGHAQMDIQDPVALEECMGDPK